MYGDLEKILFTEEEISQKISEIAKQLDEDYKDSYPLMVCILKGSVFFYTELLKKMTIPVELDFMICSSYGNDVKSSGKIKMKKDLDESIEGKDVVIIEDIIDSGKTLSYLKDTLLERKPKSLKICTLLDKKECREVDLYPDYECFTVGNEFAVGFGLDYAQKYRNLPVIGVLKKEIYTK